MTAYLVVYKPTKFGDCAFNELKQYLVKNGFKLTLNAYHLLVCSSKDQVVIDKLDNIIEKIRNNKFLGSVTYSTPGPSNRNVFKTEYV